MSTIENPSGRFMTQDQSEVTYVKDGVIYSGLASANILVESESDLTLLTGYVPGSMAHTAGWQNVWELGTDGTWVSLVE